MEQLPTLDQLGQAIRLHCSARSIGLRELERETGISKATLSRAQHGMDMRATHYRTLVKKVWAPITFPIDETEPVS